MADTTAPDFYALDETRVCDLERHAYLGRHSHPAVPVDVGFVVSVNEVPAHLVDAVKAHLSMHLDALMSDLFDDLGEATVRLDGSTTTTIDVDGHDVVLDDDDFDILARLATNVTAS